MSRRSFAGVALLLALASAGWLSGHLPAPWTGAPPRAALPELSAQLARLRPLSAEPALELAPRFSPDGRFVAFALGDERESRIVVQAVDGSSRQFVGQAGALRLSPAFFPGGRRLAFWKASGGDCAIVAYDLASGIELPLVDCALLPRVRFDLSPDGRALVFTGAADPSAPAGLWHLDLAGGQPRRLTQPATGMGDDLHPRFSPDGAHVAFFRGRARERRPWVVAISQPLRERAVATPSGSAHGLAWLGERGPLLVATDWRGRSGLHLVDVASGESRHVGPAGARFPDASAQGDLVFEVGHGMGGGAAGGLAQAADGAGAGTPSGAIDLTIARVK